MFAHRQSVFNNGSLSKSLERLSSGYRINRSSDDVAGLAVSEKLRTQIRGTAQANKNIQDGISMLQVADAAAQDVSDILQRMRELAIQAANGIYSDSDRSFIQQEINELLSEQDRIATSTNFNGIKLLMSNKIDIVLTVDSTGSMGGFIATVASVLNSFATTLSSSGISLQMGIVEYRDITDGSTGGTGIQSVTNLTSDVNTIVNQMNTIAGTVGGGGDLPESGLEALERVRQMNFRPDSQKFALLVTDATLHDAVDGGPSPPEPESGLTALEMSTVISNLTSDGIEVDAIDAPGATGVATAAIAAQTGGATTDITGGAGGMTTFLNTLATKIISLATKALVIHDGANKNQNFTSVVPGDARTKILGNIGLDISTQTNAENAILTIDKAIDKFTRTRAGFGAEQNKLQARFDFNSILHESLQASESRIRDTDMAAEIIEFTKSQVIVQSANAMLAQANLLPQNVLSLLR